jgi:hypothetical protein
VDIPVCPDGWMAAVDEDHKYADAKHAQELGQAVAVYRQEAATRLSELLESQELRIRVQPSDLELWLESGEYLTFHATGSTNGLPDAEVRLIVERDVIGIPIVATDAQRPHYGYVRGSAEDAVLNDYGPVVVRLHADVRERATVMLGDSVGSTKKAGWPCMAPERLIGAGLPVRFAEQDVRDAGSVGDACDWCYRYAEAQIYGPLRSSDIKAIVFSGGVAASGEQRRLIAGLGIPLDEIDGFPR